MSERVFEFERCFNFRDLGVYATENGRQVRSRRLFRSMTPQFMNAADVSRVRDLGIERVIDLRGDGGRVINFRGEDSTGSGPLGESPFRRVNIAFVRPPDVPLNLPAEVALAQQLALNGPTLVRAIDFLGEDGSPALIHCHGGKDRTGILAAVILKLLGVGDDDVVQDFMYSVEGFAAMQAYGEEIGEEFPPPPPNAPPHAMAPPERSWIDAILASIDKSGGAAPYLINAGASEELLERFRSGMLEAG